MTKIQITQIPGAIHIESHPASWQVVQSRKLALNIRQNKAKLNVRSRPMRLRIDQTECFASSGLKPPLRMAGDFYKSALAAGLEAISSITQEGLRFLRIEQGGNPIREIARTRGVRIKQPRMVTMPLVRPSITFEPGELNMEWTPHSVDTSWEVIEGQAEFIPHQVTITMDPYPSVEISVIEEDNIKTPEEDAKKFKL